MPDTVRLPMRDNSAGRALLLTTLALLALGVVMVHSAVASVAEPGAWYVRRDVRHTMFAAVAATILLLGWRINYRRFADDDRFPVFVAVLLGATMILAVLVFVPGVGREVGGKYRWIRFGPERYSIGFQPSELLKPAMVVFLCAWLSRRSCDVRSLRGTLLPALGVIGACVGLVVTQDFGTAVMLAMSGAVVLMLAGAPWRYLAAMTASAAGAGWALVAYSPYRWARVAAMLDPWSQTNPGAYQPRQSLLAILTGGVFGKGLGNGMLKRGYLPEAATDFIFSTYCEEWGLAGAMLLMGLIAMWIWHARRAAVGTQDRFGRLLCGSLGFLIAFQAVLHVAVDLVAAPPTGIGLPFISAGGTSLLTMTAAAAMIVSVTAHRHAERR